MKFGAMLSGRHFWDLLPRHPQPESMLDSGDAFGQLSRGNNLNRNSVLQDTRRQLHRRIFLRIIRAIKVTAVASSG